MANSKAKIANFKNQYGRKITNICADCTYPIKDCPWLHKGKEVPGWEAELVQWSRYVGVYTYSIWDCPLFVPCKRKYIGQEL